ncbi:MAG: YggS family pyridoxal phosphate-dependent enzyme [Coriobacteriales bacterium]|jgi:pyridoxal phosphate enzyme (YggS family)|nr:YggS family pyridoxal phosphate-dependent enzyme [Coriobacteriales bacterium]
MASIAENIDKIRAEVACAAERVGRDPGEIRVVAVSKTVGHAEIAQAVTAGIHDFGENRTALFSERRDAFPQERWHFIGSIQTNKVKDFAARASLVHSLASERALAAIERRIAEHESHQGATGAFPAPEPGSTLVQDVLIEVNVSGEPSKDGVAPAELERMLVTVPQYRHLQVRGLMTMAPQGDAKRARSTFRALRVLRDDLAARIGALPNVELRELSMGMSEDYVIAVEEGATILRIGRKVWQDTHG